MNWLGRRLSVEISHFQALGDNLKRILLSYTFFLMADPLLSVFISAFFWRHEQGALLIVLYRLSWVIGLPVGFIINGLLMRRIHIKYLYFFGTVVQGLGAGLAIYSGVLTITSVMFYGLLYGVAGGLFWSNKNSLDFRFSRGLNRSYYLHMNFIVSLIVNVVVPTLVGWLIAFGETVPWYNVELAYKILAGSSIFFLMIGGYLISSSKLKNLTARKLFVAKPTVRWRQNRIFWVINQMMMGLSFFLPTLLILYFGSKEGVIGTMRSTAAILSAVVLYILARKVKLKDSVLVFTGANLICLLATGFLFWQFSWLGAALYLIVLSATEPVRFSSSYAVVMEVMDDENGVRDGKTDYAYVVDNEIFFNLGRFLSMGLFLVATLVSLEFALRWVPLVVAIIQFGAIWPLQLLAKYVVNRKISAPVNS